MLINWLLYLVPSANSDVWSELDLVLWLQAEPCGARLFHGWPSNQFLLSEDGNISQILVHFWLKQKKCMGVVIGAVVHSVISKYEKQQSDRVCGMFDQWG